MDNVSTSRVDELVELRNSAAKAYYEGLDPVMTDPEFDALIAELKELGVDEVPGHGWVPDEGEDKPKKIKHEFKMQSLKKVHAINDIQRWVSSLAKGAKFIIQPKYDGLALDIVFNANGDFVQAATRGNHTYGEDVTAAVKAMMSHGRLPDHINANGFTGNTHVRGEVYIAHSDFKALNEQQEKIQGRIYVNPRNTAPGLLRRSDSQLTKYLSFVAYDTNNYEDDEVEFLDGNGFVTPKAHHYTTAETLEEVKKAVDEIGIQRFSEFEFDTDGAVIKLKANHAARESIGSTSTAPRWAVAYKYPETPTETTIRSVEWNHNRTGKLTPVAIFDNAVLSGNANTTRATLANYEKFKVFGFRPGDPILVVRANGVIPFVVGLDPKRPRSEEAPFEAPSFMPTADFPTRLSPTGKDLLAHPDAPAPLSSIIENSVKVLELKGVGSAFIEEMIEAGRVSHFIDMLSINHDEIVELRGIQLKDGERSKSADVAVEAIQTAFQKPLWRWIAAIGMKFIATSKSPILESRYSSLDELAKAQMSELVLLDKFSGDVHAQTIIDSSADIQSWADRLRDEFDFEPKPEKAVEVKAATGSIDFMGKTVVVTGTFPTMARKDVEAKVKEFGGKIGSSVSKSTDILIYGEKAGSKLAKAESLGTVEMVTAEKFEEEFKADA